jgi:hypothetical protein
VLELSQYLEVLGKELACRLETWNDDLSGADAQLTLGEFGTSFSIGVVSCWR